MNHGELDQQIFLQSKSDQNISGEVKEVWAPSFDDSPGVPHTWAKVISERGTDAFESARANAAEVIRVGLHYRDDVQTTWRFKWNDQFYYVERCDRSDRRKGWLWLTARAESVE